MQQKIVDLITQRLNNIKLANYEVKIANFIRSIETNAHNEMTVVRLQIPFYWYQLDILLQQFFADVKVEFVIEHKIYTHFNANKVKNISHIKNIIAVGSGKGGVGKSTIATNLAIALHNLGAKVGLLDADIYGPSLPQMLHTTNIKPVITDNKLIEPIVAFELPTISIGNLIEQNAAAIWRGPMASSALQQLLFQTNWPKIDYLIIDLPPGTGDVQLTMAQKIPVTGAIIVTTPQDVATIDAIKAVTMFNKVNIDILGIVSNMSYFKCDNCDKQHFIFNDQHTVDISNKFNNEIIAQLPLFPKVAHQADHGTPYMAIAKDCNEPLYEELMVLASKISYKLSLLPKNMQLPTAVVTK